MSLSLPVGWRETPHYSARSRVAQHDSLSIVYFARGQSQAVTRHSISDPREKPALPHQGHSNRK